MASSLYSQLPLNTSNSDIRTLTVHPSDDHEAPINASLNVASLNDNCDFEALSYVWHEPSLADVAPVAILVNGYEFTPTPNLFSALQHLRLPQTPRKLWVDAICINQGDIDERSAQVPLMTRIYTSAQAVAVWLGPSNDEIDTYARLEPQMAADIRLLKELLSRHFENLSGPADPEVVTEMERLWLERALKLRGLLPGHISLVSNTYWSRMWTYQECCLPSTSRFFYCGYNLLTQEQVGNEVFIDHMMGLNHLKGNLEEQRDRSGGRPYLPGEREDCSDSLAIGLGAYIRDAQNLGGSSSIGPGHFADLNVHLLKTRYRTCKDPLDRFYALHGLIRNPSIHFPVDYTKDVHTVSAQIASCLIVGGLGAQFFDSWDYGASRNSTVPAHDARPSWVPGFRVPTSLFYHQYGEEVRVSSRNRVISVCQSLSMIKIQGKAFGPARVLARFKSSAIDDMELFVRGLGQNLSSLTARPALESFRKSIERLIIMLLIPHIRDEIETAMRMVAELVEFLLDWHAKSLDQLDEASSGREDNPSNLRQPKVSEMDETWWHLIVGDRFEAKAMFVTDDLHLGFCDAQIRDGDIVARLGNQRGSCVLRRCETGSPDNPLEESVTMVCPSEVMHLPLIWDAKTEDSDTWFEDMTMDETEPVVFTIR